MITVNRIKWTEEVGPDVVVQCRRCAVPTAARSYERVEQVYVLYFIPTFKKTTTYVVCRTCNTSYVSKLRVADLHEHAGQDVTAYLRPEASFGVVVLAFSSLVVAFMPVLGVIVAAVAAAVTWRSPNRGVRLLAQFALLVSLCVTGYAVYSLLHMNDH